LKRENTCPKCEAPLGPDRICIIARVDPGRCEAMGQKACDDCDMRHPKHLRKCPWCNEAAACLVCKRLFYKDESVCDRCHALLRTSAKVDSTPAKIARINRGGSIPELRAPRAPSFPSAEAESGKFARTSRVAPRNDADLVEEVTGIHSSLPVPQLPDDEHDSAPEIHIVHGSDPSSATGS